MKCKACIYLRKWEICWYYNYLFSCFFGSHAWDSQLDLTCYITPHKLQEVIVDDPDLVIEDVDFSDKYLALIVRENRNFQLCSVGLPLPFEKVIKENLL